ncbi:hypothetical protein [Enterococcus asini]|uniref:hypothetical protein n=1 Tax=Enterococcus asini TaxID=57732 RepID=UPI0022E6D761|nr:hypothetical protein [Enterococcus asini]
MNNRHRRIARLKKQLEQPQVEIIDWSKAIESVTAAFENIKKAIGSVFEVFGESLVKMGRAMQGKEPDTLMHDLSTEEWVALSRYIRGDLYIGGANEGREEQIELFRSAAIKIIRIGDVLEGDQL